MNEEEARIEYARLLAVAVDWSRRLQASPRNAFVARQQQLAVERAEAFGAEVLRSVVLS